MAHEFSGYATRNDRRCTDGRTIRQGAFAAQDGEQIPLVWQHLHNEPGNILGHAVLENRDDGVYAYCTFNNNPLAQEAKEAVRHKDVKSLSIYANKLVQKGGDVLHGVIREVSLVLSGANPGAFIDNVVIQHSDGDIESTDEVIIYFDEDIHLSHEETQTQEDPEMPKANQMAHEDKQSSNDKTVGDVFTAMTKEQKDVVYFMIGEAIKSAGVEGDDDDDMEQSGMYNDEGDNFMKHNVFDSDGDQASDSLAHIDVPAIVSDAKRIGSFKESVLAHAASYGIEDIDVLFPDAKSVMDAPELISRQMEWVQVLLGKTKHSPFSRIKSLSADITHEEARARGFIKGNLKKEEFFGIKDRRTEPTTIYKKQKLDQDDIHDITDFDVVAWLKAEMRLMLNEELARAILIGDGRDLENGEGEPNEDKIDETRIRPIWTDDDFYSRKVAVPATAGADVIVDSIIAAMPKYKGTGSPTMFTSAEFMAKLLLQKDKLGRRLYRTKAELAAELGVGDIVPVEVMENQVRLVDDAPRHLFAIIVNPADYTVGADRGGDVSMFEDFDIDYNQRKYLIETRASGALTKHQTALVIEGDPGMVPETGE